MSTAKKPTPSAPKTNITKLTITAMLAAVAVVLQYLEFGVPLVPAFLKMDLSDIPELIGAFIIGPFGGALIALLKNLIHLPATQTAGVGELANFLLGAVFSLTAGAIYKRNKTKKSAILACFCGTFAMAAVSFPINLWIVYPLRKRQTSADEDRKAVRRHGYDPWSV